MAENQTTTEVMYLQITDACNLRCPFCYMKRNHHTMTLDTALNMYQKYRPREIIFHGGEPMLYPNLILDIMDHIPDTTYSVTTNMTLPWDEMRHKVLSRCTSIATSYSVDRFPSWQIYNIFKNNLNYASQYVDITILVTLSRAQLKKPPELLAQILSTLPHSFIRLERLYESTYDKDLAQQTDKYLLKLFQLLPEKENVLYQDMVNSIKNHIPVFSLSCAQNIKTVTPEGNIKTCPNTSNHKITKRKECILCNLYEYCKGDCLSFQNGCMFPKETMQWILEKER